jgi:chromosome segregation ATPase
MSETAGSQKPTAIHEHEAAVLRALDLYFETRRHEVEQSKEAAGPALARYEEARRQIAQSEEELLKLRGRTEELQAEAMSTVARGSGASELEKDVSELQKELQEKIHDLAEAEKTAQGRKAEAEERLRRAELDFEADLGKALNEVAAVALHEAEEIDAFKGRLDRRFAEGRMFVLEAAN